MEAHRTGRDPLGTFDAECRAITPHHGLLPCLSALAIVLVLTPLVNAGVSDSEATVSFDCGFNALFVLLDLEGRPVSLDRLAAALPPAHPDGYSMAELAGAARSLGLEMEGVHFVQGDRALERPAIAFLEDTKGGHFLVLRPVGTTGTMIQVIDPPHVPRIVDYDQLFTVRSWTGRILLPRDPWLVRHAGSLILSGLSVPLIAFPLWRHFWRRPGPPKSPETSPADHGSIEPGVGRVGMLGR